MDQRAALNAELERAALRALIATYDDLNLVLFSGSLRRPPLSLSDSRATLGQWHRSSRAIEISREVLVKYDWGVAVEVLKHEMAHQYVDEVLGAKDEAAHGPLFRNVCSQRAIDARASGVPESTGGDEVSHVLAKVSKLLALAESANEHEAKAAMSASHRLLLKHNLEAQGMALPRGYRFRHLGKASGRVGESQRVLAGILSDFFFVEAIWVPVWRPLEGKPGSILEICGTAENLEIAEYTHAFLVRTAERLWRDYRREHGILRNAARRTFISGVMSGFRERLEADRSKTTALGLVWVGDPQLQGYLRQRHPRIRWTRHRMVRVDAAYDAGRNRGRELVLARGVSEGPRGGGPCPELPGRSFRGER